MVDLDLYLFWVLHSELGSVGNHDQVKVEGGYDVVVVVSHVGKKV
jgi:hypothetical protein